MQQAYNVLLKMRTSEVEVLDEVKGGELGYGKGWVVGRLVCGGGVVFVNVNMSLCVGVCVRLSSFPLQG